MSFSAKNQTNPFVVDVTGYTPYVMARAERATHAGGDPKAKHRAEAVRDYWVKQNFLDSVENYVTQHDKDLFRSRWECAADKKGLYSRVKWEMDKVTVRMNEELEKRRNKLTELLKAEEEMYLEETNNLQEDVERKNKHMLERYKKLKTKKERERQKIAKEKKEQHFRSNCDELRALVSKKVQKEIVKDGKQIRLQKESELKQRTQDENIFAEMWIKDSEAKAEKEVKEEEYRKARNMEFGQHISEQMKKKNMEKLIKAHQKEEDAEMMAEQKKLMDLEHECELHQKKLKQKEVKKGLDICVKDKLKRRAKDVQDDLMDDLLFLQKIMADDEDAKKAERKKTLMNEQQQYLAYLKEQIAKEAAFQKELDETYQTEFSKMWDKREEEWDAEKKKRRQLEKDVMKECEAQILSNLEKSRQVQAMRQVFAQKVLEQDEIDRKKDQEKLQLIKEKNAVYQDELIEQIKMNSEKIKAERIQKEKEVAQLIIEQKEHEEKVQELLKSLKLDYQHPYRTNISNERN